MNKLSALEKKMSKRVGRKVFVKSSGETGKIESYTIDRDKEEYHVSYLVNINGKITPVRESNAVIFL